MAKHTVETHELGERWLPAYYTWQATLDNYEAGDPIGYGETEADAVADLFRERSNAHSGAWSWSANR